MKKLLVLLMTLFVGVVLLFAEDRYTQTVVIRSVVKEVVPEYSLDVLSYENLEVELMYNAYVLYNTDMNVRSTATLAINQTNVCKIADNVRLIVKTAGCSIFDVNLICDKAVINSQTDNRASLDLMHNGCRVEPHTVATFQVDVTAEVAFVQLVYATF